MGEDADPDKVDSFAKATELNANPAEVPAGACRSTAKVPKNARVLQERIRSRDVAVRSSDAELS